MTVRRVRKIAGTELKHINLQQTLAPTLGGTGTLLAITAPIAQGLAANNRIGDWVQPVNCHGHITVAGFPGAAVPTVNLKLAFLIWKEDANIQTPTNTLMLANNNPLSPWNFQSKGMFKIIWTKTFAMSNNPDAPQFLKKLSYYIRMSRMQRMFYDGVAARKNQLYLIAYSDAQLAEEPPLKISVTFRYTDG